MFLDKKEDIESVLILTQLQAIPLSVHLKGVADKVFSSALVEISSEIDGSPTLLIESLVPEIGNDIILYSKALSVEFSIPEEDGEGQVRYLFNADYIRKESFEGRPALRISFPERRRHARVEPRSGEQIVVAVHFEGGVAVQPLFNISVGGVAFYCDIEAEEIMQAGRFRVSFSLPGGTDVSAAVVPRWISKLEKEERIGGRLYSIFCGVEFEDIDAAVRQQVQQYVRGREQEELKKILDDDAYWVIFD